MNAAWKCPECGELNPSYRYWCHGCSRMRDARSVEPSDSVQIESASEQESERTNDR